MFKFKKTAGEEVFSDQAGFGGFKWLEEVGGGGVVVGVEVQVYRKSPAGWC